jgi:REP element-mobilizing transposase RayT
MNERMKRRAKYRTWKKGYYHLCTDGKTSILCHDDAEYANLVNVIAVLPQKFPVKVHSYKVMRSHVHLLLSGRGTDCVDAFDYLKYRASRRLREDGHEPLPKNYDFRLIPVEDEDQMRRNIVYMARNAFEVQDVLPGCYLWGASMIFYSQVPRLFETVRAGDLSARQLWEILGTRIAVPDDYLIHLPTGMVLPQSFIDTKVFYRVFPTARQYQTALVKDFEGYVMVADRLGETVVFTQEEVGMIIEQVLAMDYQGAKPDQLTKDERFRLASDLQKKYRLSVDQLAAGLHVSVKMLAQALRSKQYR